MEQGAVKDNKLLRLFLSTLYISAFTFGGGFVIVTFMKKKFVDELHWIGEEEMMDYIALAQSSPGAISVNAAILVGWKIGNFPGMMIAVLGTIIPPVVILSVLSFFYNFFASNAYIALLFEGMQAGVAAVILNVVLDLSLGAVKVHRLFYWISMICAFLASFFFRINAVYIILAMLFLSILLTICKGVRFQ